MLTIITPTGGRQESFNVLTECIRQQTHQDFEWIVIDDCEIPTEIPSDIINIKHIRPEPYWKRGQVTLARNLKEGLQHVSNEKVVIMEDDDWYHPRWLDTVSKWLDRHNLVGECDSHYYNVKNQTGRNMNNRRHASLCATAMRGPMIDNMLDLLKTVDDKIDVKLWRKYYTEGKLYPWNGLVVGIKGLPGREGIGVGHSLKGKPVSLSEWIPNWEEYYKGIL